LNQCWSVFAACLVWFYFLTILSAIVAVTFSENTMHVLPNCVGDNVGHTTANAYISAFRKIKAD
jgi:hypothetical protein